MIYVGNKDKPKYTQFLQAYINAHEITRVVDVFGGSGGASLRLDVPQKHYNELNPDVYKLVSWLATEATAEDIRGIVAEWGEHIYTSVGPRGNGRRHIIKDYYKARKAEYLAGNTDIKLLYALTRYCFGGTIGKISGISAGSYSRLEGDIKKLPQYKTFTEFSNLCYSELEYIDDPKTLYIFDPPYTARRGKPDYSAGFDVAKFWGWLAASTMPHVVAFDIALHDGLAVAAESRKVWTLCGKSEQNSDIEYIFTR